LETNIDAFPASMGMGVGFTHPQLFCHRKPKFWGDFYYSVIKEEIFQIEIVAAFFGCL